MAGFVCCCLKRSESSRVELSLVERDTFALYAMRYAFEWNEFVGIHFRFRPQKTLRLASSTVCLLLNARNLIYISRVVLSF